MSNNTLNSLRKQLTFDFMLDFTAVFGTDVHLDHSTISRFISRNPKQIEDVFRQSVEKLASLGELGKKVVFQDETKIESRAGKYTFVWKSATEKNMEKCLSRISKLLGEAVEVGLIQTDELTCSEPERLLASAVNAIDEQGLFNPHEKKGRGHHKSKVNKLREKAVEELEKLETQRKHLSMMEGRNSLSKTDTDATFMRMKEDYMRNGQLKPAYNIQNAVDSNYIVASSISSDRTDCKTAEQILEKLDMYSWKYDIYCADSGYDSLESFRNLKKRGIEAYIKPQDWEISKTRKYKNDCGKVANMKYVEDGDYFVCRNNRKLLLTGTKKRKGCLEASRIYECHWGCVTCPYRESCIKNPGKDRFKKLSVQLEHRQYQRVAYEKLSSEFGTEVRVNRSIQVEGRFAFQKQQFSLRRFCSFGKTRVFSEWLICCMAVNTVQLAARIEQDKVGSPFWYRIKAGLEEETA